MDNIRNDIVNDISAQTSNKCNCNFSLPSRNAEVSIQSINTSQHDDLGTFLLHASLQNCINNRCAQRQALEDWYSGPTPHVTVGTLTFLLLRDRKCPLYTSSLSSSECLPMEPQPLLMTDHSLESGSDNTGATVAGALIGGIALGIALTVSIGLVIFFLLRYRQHHHHGKNVKMMKKIEVDSEAPLSTRYIPANKNINNEDYEPISVHPRDTEDPGLDNAYEPIRGGQPPLSAAAVETKISGSNQKKKKKNNVNSASASNEISGQKVIQEDAAGYVVPDILWEGKQRPVAPAEKTKSARVQTPDKRSPLTVSASTAVATKTVEYDIPEGVDTSQSRTHVQPASKVKGQREESSKDKSQQPISNATGHSTQQLSSGKGHHKQPAAPDNSQQEKASQVQPQPRSNQLHGKELARPVQEGSKPNKKSKPNLQQKTHDNVKSKLHNLLSPMPASGNAHTPPLVLPKQTSSSTVENTKVTKLDSDSPASKVKAMASMLEGGGSTPSTASGSDVSDSKSAGAKKKYVCVRDVLNFVCVYIGREVSGGSRRGSFLPECTQK